MRPAAAARYLLLLVFLSGYIWWVLWRKGQAAIMVTALPRRPPSPAVGPSPLGAPVPAATTVPGAQVPRNATLCAGRHCYRRVGRRVRWTAAEAHCAAEGAHLASVHSADENDLVGRVAGCCQGNYWIGLHKAGGAWRWTDGSAADFFAWAPGEPNNWRALQENVVSVWPKRRQWNDDTDRGENVRLFVCKWRRGTESSDPT